MADHQSARARSGAGVVLRPEVLTIEVRGPDRVRFLNGMVTNDVAALVPGQGVLAVKVSAKGRVEAVVRIRALEEALAIEVREVVAEKLAGALASHLIMDDCTLADATPSREVVTILGPRSAEILRGSGVQVLDSLPAHAFVRSGECVVIRDVTLGLAGFEVHVPPGAGALFRDRLIAAGAAPLDAEAVEVIRIEEGVPIDGRDLGEDVLPMEAGLLHAISFTKGCYVGQEVIARGTNLGGVRWALVRLRLSGELAPGTKLLDAGDRRTEVGEVTSVVLSESVGAWIALGFVRTSHAASGTHLTTATGTDLEVR